MSSDPDDLEALDDPNRSARAPRVFLPYRPFALEPRLPLAVDAVEVDDAGAQAEALDAARCRVRPHVVASWRRVRLQVSLPNVEKKVRAFAFGDLTKREPALCWLVTLHCESTRLRHAVPLARAGRSLRAELVILRDDVDGSVELEAVATRGETAGEPVPGRASEPFALLARSPRWLIEVDERAAVPGGAFDFAWIDFAKPEPEGTYRGEDAAALQAQPDALAHVAFRPHGPLVLVNRRRPLVFETLTARGTVGARARLRDVLLLQVATTAWRSILTEALDACRADADGWADLGDEHWASLALDHAARSWRKGAPRAELLDALDDRELRPGLLFELAEKLGRVGRLAILRLIEESCGR